MAKFHTDREILRCIYDMHVGDYPTKGDPLIPVDLYRLAEVLRTSPHILFGRLHYDMGTRLRHRSPTDPNVTVASIFEPLAGNQRHVVNFPYLTAVLASLEEANTRDRATRGLAIAAIVVSIATAAAQITAEWTSDAKQTKASPEAASPARSSAGIFPPPSR